MQLLHISGKQTTTSLHPNKFLAGSTSKQPRSGANKNIFRAFVSLPCGYSTIKSAVRSGGGGGSGGDSRGGAQSSADHRESMADLRLEWDPLVKAFTTQFTWAYRQQPTI